MTASIFIYMQRILKKMHRAIITGFEPFGDYAYNPVQDLAQEMNGKRAGGFEVIGLVLPCTYYGAFQLLTERMDRFSPDLVIGSGLASRVRCIRFEAFGRNVMNGKYADADGRKPDNQPIVNGGKEFYPTNVNNVHLADSLNGAGIPAEVSVDAGGFICNSFIYLTARKISEEQLPVKFAFFHTPWTDDYQSKISLEQGKVWIKRTDLTKTVETILLDLGD